jgi:hypothetical protein
MEAASAAGSSSALHKVTKSKKAMKSKEKKVDIASTSSIVSTFSIASTSTPTDVVLVKNIVYFKEQFAPRRYITYSRFNDREIIQFREYDSNGNQEYPTKKGVALTPIRLKVLRENIEKIDEALRQQEVNASYDVKVLDTKELCNVHLGGGFHARVSENFPGVDFRMYWLPVGELESVPTRKGIFLPQSQWTCLKEKLSALVLAHPDLEKVESCFHQNQMGMVYCSECMPFGWTF